MMHTGPTAAGVQVKAAGSTSAEVVPVPTPLISTRNCPSGRTVTAVVQPWLRAKR